MKTKIAAAVCAMMIICSAQSQVIDKQIVKRENKNIEEFWNEKDANFEVNTIPEKWKNESAVIIAQKSHLFFDKKAQIGKAIAQSLLMFGANTAGKLKIQEEARWKIKLNDKSAVKNFSEIYFDGGGEYDGFKLQVIKPGGKSQAIDISASIKVPTSSSIPYFFRNYLSRISRDYTPGYYKLAVPNLEPGDIIDYAYTINYDINTKVTGQSLIEFEPVYYLCNKDYSVMSQQIMIQTDNKSYVNTKSFNTAPAFKTIENEDYNAFMWEDKNREKVKDQRWLNDYIVLPMVKYQVIYSKNKNRSDAFIGNSEELKTNITPDELARKVNAMTKVFDGIDDYIVRYYSADLKKAKLTSALPNDEYIRKLFYFLRSANPDYEDAMNDDKFIAIFHEMLKRRKIQADLIITTPNDLSLLKDVTMKNELRWLLRIDGKYIFNPSAYTGIYEGRIDCQGNDAYLVTLGATPSATKITLPHSTYQDNKGSYYIESSIDENLENLNITATNQYEGFTKRGYSYAALAYTNAFREDYKNYGGRNRLDDLKAKEKEKVDREMAAVIEEETKKKPEYMKRQLQGDYGNIVAYKEFKLINDGRSFEDPRLKYAEKFVLGDMVKKAGKNLLVSIPALMGGQFQIKDEERTRQYDVDIRFARTNRWNIIFDIPTGYSLDGLSDLNISVENETGAFVSQAKMEGNQLILEVKKIYKQKDVKKEDWSKMLEFLDAAYNFSQKKILLRKV